MKQQSTADLAKIYLKIRNAIKAKEEEIKNMKEELSVIESALQEVCEAEGANSLSTPEGTVIRRTIRNYWTSDWDNMYKTIADNNAFHLLEKRIHNSNMKDFLNDNPSLAPPGLQSTTKHVISVRKPTSK